MDSIEVFREDQSFQRKRMRHLHDERWRSTSAHASHGRSHQIETVFDYFLFVGSNPVHPVDSFENVYSVCTYRRKPTRWMDRWERTMEEMMIDDDRQWNEIGGQRDAEGHRRIEDEGEDSHGWVSELEPLYD